jgi:K+-transporting ATPase ATPase C chain
MKTFDLTERRPKVNTGQFHSNGRGGAASGGGDEPAAIKEYSILQETISSILATIVLAVIVSGFYPLLVWAIGQGVFHHQANGSLIVAADGKTVLGSELLGQNFGGKRYFNPRPSAAGAAGYDPTASGGTNLGPTSDKLVNGQHKKDAAGNAVNDPSNYDGIKDLVAAYRAANGLKPGAAVPADAVTRSGSGLDPDISVSNAMIQLPRVARERGLGVDVVRQFVDKYTAGPDLRIFGEPRVNTLMLNLALDGKLPAGAH